MSDKPNCYKCIHRGEVPGSAHSSCKHPSVPEASPMERIMATFASVGRSLPVVNTDAASELGIRGDAHGIRNGWFNWPHNFDPVWLEACDGFESEVTP